jgi:hypothetical protein
MAGSSAAENPASYLQQLALPLADLVGTHAMLAGQFVARLQPLLDDTVIPEPFATAAVEA